MPYIALRHTQRTCVTVLFSVELYPAHRINLTSKAREGFQEPVPEYLSGARLTLSHRDLALHFPRVCIPNTNTSFSLHCGTGSHGRNFTNDVHTPVLL